MTELFSIPYNHVWIPSLIFVFSILLYLYVCTSEGTYASLPPVATLYIFRNLPQYKMKSKVVTPFVEYAT